MRRFVVSDTHFGHRKIIEYCNRPFDNEDEMDETMVERWNAVVRPGDRVWHLGDFAIARRKLAIAKRLNGKKGILLGNHDIYKAKEYLEAGFKDVQAMRVYPGVCILTHVPIHPGNFGRWRVNVHGHIHNGKSPDGPYANVSVEVINYTPIELDAVLEQFKHIPKPERKRD
jgi:calcineurin-like phosphoesterase family protein